MAGEQASLAAVLCRHFRVERSSSIGWAHAVNSVAELDRALSDPTVHMIEADISWASELGAAVMQHPGALRGETFADWLAAFVASDTAPSRGLKLDFKDLASVEPCLAAVAALSQQPPLWLNADILDGPCGAVARVDQRRFVDLCTAHCPGATLSLGWSTGQPSVSLDGYSSEHIGSMWEVCSRLPDTTYVTFPVRATSVVASAESAQQLRLLLARRPSSFSLTLWGRITDECVEQLVEAVDRDTTFFDIQDINGTQRAPV